MNNLYFIESDNHIILNSLLKDIASENKFDFSEIIRFDLSERNISDVITELDTYSLFSDRKIVFGYDCVFLTTDKTDINHDIDMLTKYINNPKEDSVLILSCKKLDGKKNICKLIKEKFKVEYVSKEKLFRLLTEDHKESVNGVFFDEENRIILDNFLQNKNELT